MNMLFVAMLVMVVVVLALLVVLERIKLPILVETGFALIAFGALVAADAVAEDSGTHTPSILLTSLGLVLVVASVLRQKSKRAKRMRLNEPRVITGQDLRKPSGGRKP